MEAYKLYNTGVIAGNFDVIHPGYIHMFTKMKEVCSKVIVLLQGDPTIERPLKCKPILSINERKDILKSLKQIDYIEVYNLESELLELLKSINPDVRFLGDDYKNKPYTGDDLGIDIHYIKRDHGWSTTKFKNLIAKSI
tara:strand:+ start:3120 stop:3536 length:417 start_codon:yes stop_codon:yes gene_type:complete